jgi:Rps23 Pro-64 3,4-dihydroxylase Tpa1-like proline 4-hydroxylase
VCSSDLGKLAFVYNATRLWDDRDGGQFQLLSPDWSEVVVTVPPRHNSFTFFRVEDQGVPHRVLPVATTTARRLSISGWLV